MGFLPSRYACIQRETRCSKAAPETRQCTQPNEGTRDGGKIKGKQNNHLVLERRFKHIGHAAVTTTREQSCHSGGHLYPAEDPAHVSLAGGLADRLLVLLQDGHQLVGDQPDAEALEGRGQSQRSRSRVGETGRKFRRNSPGKLRP